MSLTPPSQPEFEYLDDFEVINDYTSECESAAQGKIFDGNKLFATLTAGAGPGI